jgi:hypothetical protein
MVAFPEREISFVAHERFSNLRTMKNRKYQQFHPSGDTSICIQKVSFSYLDCEEDYSHPGFS